MKWLPLLATLLLAPTVSAGGNIVITDAWIREAPPGARTLAAFMRIQNTGDQTLVLNHIDSPAFEHVMLHQSSIVDGIARMQSQDSISIPAGESVSLQPGGFHLMMPAPEPGLQAGDQAVFYAHFSDDSCVRINAIVKKK